MEDLLEHENHHVPIVPKKIRHRKKQRYQAIQSQMEFYFSDSNLSKDRFLSELTKTDPYVDLTVFLKFNKMRTLTDNTREIAKALKNSTMLQLNEDKTKVCRTTPVQKRENVDECTIYVERIPSDINHDDLSKIFSQFGPVSYISIPRYKHNRMIKGFAFVEFESIEAAKKTLDHFAAIGCKLPSQMPPDKLYSIITFTSTEENASNENENQENQAEETEKKDEQKSEDTKVPSSSIEDNSETKLKTTNKNEIIEEVKEKPKKRKLSQTEETGEVSTKKLKPEVSEVDASESTEEERAEGTEDVKMEQETETEKKRRRRKKRAAGGIDVKEMGLQVLSKQEWKRLRNKYLDLQRAKMKSLKQQLYRARFSNTNNQLIAANAVNSQSEAETKTGKNFNLTSGTVVHMELPQPCIDLKSFKTDLKNYSTEIKYVDVREGDFQAYIRFSSSNAAQKFIDSPFPATMTILDGDMEKQYFEKAEKDREEKFSKTKTKLRGRDKLLRKAEKELGKHIRFEETD